MLSYKFLRGGIIIKRVISIIAIYMIIALIPFFFNYSSYSKVDQTEQLIEELEDKTHKVLKKYDIPGATISIISHGEVKWVGSFGNQDEQNEIKMSDQTVFQVASISKSVTALGVMKLVDEGYINLDDPIGKYVTRWNMPESDYDQNKVTIRSLLSHTSGLSLGGGYPGYEPGKQLPTLEESLSGIGGGSRPVELIRNSGEMYSYSGGGYSLLQLLIEEVTGKSFAEYMKDEVLIPLEMNNSSFYWTEPIKSQTAKAYDEQMNELPNYLFIELAAAGLYTTVHDMNKFVIYSLNNYQSNTELYTPVLDVTGLNGIVYNKIALGHFINIGSDGSPIVAHDGANNGWRSNYSFIPEKGEGIVILTNGNNGTYLINEVLDAWYFTIFGVQRSFNSLSSKGSALIYSISSVIVLWSIFTAIKLIKGMKEGTRKITSFAFTWRLIIKVISFILMIFLLYILKEMAIPILNFINPDLGIVLFIALCTRVIMGILQLILIRHKGLKVVI